MLIGLISCTKAKTPYPAPARELYSPSGLFRGALRTLEGRADAIYVLSAKYGLLPLDQVVAPYDQTLKDASPADRANWARAVVQALHARHGSLNKVTFEIHAGMAYRNPLESLLQREGGVCTCPVDGLSMGQRLAFYAQGAPARPAQVPTAAWPARAPAQTVTDSDLHTFIGGLTGRTLQTGTGKPFLVEQVTAERVVVVPEETKKPRPIRWAEVEGAHAMLLRKGAITLADVRAESSEANPAYVFALLAELPDVTLVHDRPMRLELED